MRTIFSALITIALAGALQASQPVGSVIAVSGKVSLFSAGADKAKELQLGKPVYAGDRLKTGANGRASLVLADGTALKVNYNTDITLRAADSKGKASERGVGSIKLALGEIWAKVTKKNSRLEFDTPAAVAAVKGTEPILSVDEVGTLCAKLREGSLEISNDKGSLDLSELQQVCVSKGSKPSGAVKWVDKGDFSKEVGAPTGAEVKLLFKDGNGNVKEAVLEYEKP
jgi:ferric-dicitrate binding protein FerR (iron transport regulator)